MQTYQETPAAVAAALDGAGFAVVPTVLSRSDVAAARALCDALLVDRSEQQPSELIKYPQLSGVVVAPAVTDVLAAVLGRPFVLYPNLTVRRDVFVDWHVDDAFAGPGKEYAWQPGFVHVQGAVYLQDNTEADAGGAIDVVPGSHRASVDGRGTAAPDYRGLTGSVTVQARAGDLVLWHARTVHRSTPRAAAADAGAKYGIFFSAGRPDVYENNRFVTHLAAKRFVRRNGRAVPVERQIDTARLRYPDSFDPDWVRRLERSGGSVCSLFL